MAGFHETMIFGNLGRDPETRDTRGDTVTNLNVAVNEVWKDRDGNKKENTIWYRVAVWGNQADACARYLSKGSQVLVVGRLQNPRVWTTKDGEHRASLEMKATRVVFAGSGDGKSRDERNEDRWRSKPREESNDNYRAEDDDGQDVPF